MGKIAYIIWMLLLAALTVLLMPYAVEVVKHIFFQGWSMAWEQVQWYKWCALGVAAYCVFHHFVTFNIKYLETKSHEGIHELVAFFFLRRVHESRSGEGNGQIRTSGENLWQRCGLLPLSLAPYCLPVWVLIMLALRVLIADNSLWIYDILVGIMLGFQILCFKEQTRSNQTDINQYPLSFSYFYIYLARLANALIILVAFFPESRHNLLHPYIALLKAMWDTLLQLVAMI